MANHIPLVATPPSSGSLAAFVKSFAQRYSQYRNRLRRGSGKLFEERYWSVPIRTEFHLAAATMYIDRNPVAAGVKSDPAEYRWSSYRLNSGIGKSERSIAATLSPSTWYASLGTSQVERTAEYVRIYSLYAETALARAQEQFFAKLERNVEHHRRLERPNRSSARDRVSRYRPNRQ